MIFSGDDKKDEKGANQNDKDAPACDWTVSKKK